MGGVLKCIFSYRHNESPHTHACAHTHFPASPSSVTFHLTTTLWDNNGSQAREINTEAPRTTPQDPRHDLPRPREPNCRQHFLNALLFPLHPQANMVPAWIWDSFESNCESLRRSVPCWLRGMTDGWEGLPCWEFSSAVAFSGSLKNCVTLMSSDQQGHHCLLTSDQWGYPVPDTAAYPIWSHICSMSDYHTEILYRIVISVV